MPIFNHEGGSEASGDKGEKYKQAIEEYLRARGYSIERRSNHHSTTEDLAAVSVDENFHLVNGEKVGDDVKNFVRVEAKATKLSRLDEDFLTELARVFIDYCEEDGEFEYHIYASYLQAFDKWERIFDPRTNTPEDISSYFDTLRDRQNLNDAEEVALQSLDIEDFEWFLTDVFVHRASWDRLKQMAEDERSVNRSKWDFYTRENSPSRESETLVPNFLRISRLPESIYIGESLADHPEDIYAENPRYLPIWAESGLLHSLIAPGKMSDSLQQYVDMASVESRDFTEWVETEENAPEIAKRLFNRAIRRRVVDNYDDCIMVRHRYETRLLFIHETEKSEEDEGTISKTQIDGWDVAMDWGGYVAHRYASPAVKQYEDQFYVIIDTGWLFSSSGRGTNILKGDVASRLHDQLQSSGHYRPNNLKAQFRQWRAYLGMDDTMDSLAVDTDTDPQRLEFEREAGLKIRARPPKDGAERDLLMQRGVDTY